MLIILCVAALAVFDTTHAGCSKSRGKNSTADSSVPRTCTDDNEHYEECGNSCTVTCDNMNDGPIACTQQCDPGCRCDDGYVRNSDGKCVQPDDCPRAYQPPDIPRTCTDDNEHYEECGNSCTVTCDNMNDGPIACTQQCDPGCRCDDGYVRNSDGKCVQPDDCPRAYQPPAKGGGKGPGRRPGSCPRNQHWDSCGNSCVVTCDNYNDPPDACAEQCAPGCRCNDGFVKNGNGRCVKPKQCPRAYNSKALNSAAASQDQDQGQGVKCPINQHYESCGTACPDTCENYNNNTRCTKQCEAGCQCNEGLVLTRDRQCIPPGQCRPQNGGAAASPSSGNAAYYCGYNQHYEQCGTPCPLTCANYYDPPSACPAYCVYGCQCDEGYIIDPNGNCVQPSQCPGDTNPKCEINERYSNCTSYCPVTCDSINGGAPQSCAQGCKGKGCECANGFVRNKNGRCVKPQDCQYNTCRQSEVYTNCVVPCNDCQNRGNCGTYNCYPGCDCIRGYYRNADGVCVPADQCPNTCKRNEYYSNCVIPCNDCYNRGNCYYYCYPGCDCYRGYYRNANGVCVAQNQC